MQVIIFAVIVGSGIGYFATQNTGLISLYFGSYIAPNIPIYIVVMGALLLGLLLAWIFNLINAFSSKLALHSKEGKIKEANKTVAELTKETHHLEIDNARLKERLGEGETDDKSL
ncbi:MAG: lipopolysaccharide assembly protein LapA domain-containing protein [bacterium]|nr:lipopolysaccharide assembly protein LapA domain-containing protein [bacterium]